ncbi:phage holin family protein, partial [Isoptericola sp. NPDC057191]|uniref:phage holin family protein n=1 Tax=Isoptericola sp. NPDC057191 TaxID=3346041 RepID=UPI003632336B
NPRANGTGVSSFPATTPESRTITPSPPASNCLDQQRRVEWDRTDDHPHAGSEQPMSDWDDGRTPPAEQPPSMGRLVEQLSEQATRLVRAEVALAKAEMAEKAKRSGIGLGLIAAALVIVLYAVGVLIWAGITGLATAWPLWLSALVVGVAMLIVAGIAVAIAVGQLKKAARRPETIDRVKEDVETVKKGVRR